MKYSEIEQIKHRQFSIIISLAMLLTGVNFTVILLGIISGLDAMFALGVIAYVLLTCLYQLLMRVLIIKKGFLKQR